MKESKDHYISLEHLFFFFSLNLLVLIQIPIQNASHIKTIKSHHCIASIVSKSDAG